MADKNEIIEVGADGETPKKSKKPKIILICVVVFIGMLIAANAHAKNKEAQNTGSSSVVEEEDTGDEEEPVEELSDAEAEQQSFIKEWGTPPEGFRWDEEKNLVPVSDKSLTDEEVISNYLRALSTLNMETVQKYAYNSAILDAYTSYFSEDASEDYTIQFQRQILSKSLQSLEVEGIENKAVFANGRRIVTVKIKVMDLSYKDFWKDDQDKVYNDLRTCLSGESDNVKAQKYVYDLILNYFKKDNPDVKYKETSVDIVLDKVSFGGWTVTDDTSLDMLCEYKDGTSIYEYIMQQYSTWIEETLEQEEAEREQEAQ